MIKSLKGYLGDMKIHRAVQRIAYNRGRPEHVGEARWRAICKQICRRVAESHAAEQGCTVEELLK